MTFVIPVGIAAIVLGMRGFSARGIPLTKRKSIGGTRGKIIGAVCIIVGITAIIVAVVTLRASVQQADAH
jgi:hypothetical protein